MTTTPPITPADWGDLARQFTSHSHVLIEAGDLLSEHGDNPEYDRAIVELTTRLLGRSHDEDALVHTAIIRAYSRYTGEDEDEPEAAPQWTVGSFLDALVEGGSTNIVDDREQR